MSDTQEPVTRRKKCKNDQHKDRMIRGGKRVECTVCGDSFPCTTDCDHFDCKWVRDEPETAMKELGYVNE